MGHWRGPLKKIKLGEIVNYCMLMEIIQECGRKIDVVGDVYKWDGGEG